jgi:membrane protease YdiL (CAAX protease family)
MYPLIKQAGHPHLALWGTSLTFALIHLNLKTFLPLTALALLLTWLYERTDNLLTSIIAHGAFNFSSVLLLYFGDDMTNLLKKLFGMAIL